MEFCQFSNGQFCIVVASLRNGWGAHAGKHSANCFKRQRQRSDKLKTWGSSESWVTVVRSAGCQSSIETVWKKQGQDRTEPMVYIMYILCIYCILCIKVKHLQKDSIVLLSNSYLSPTSPAFCTGAPRKSCKVSRHWEMFGSSAKAEPRAWKLTLKSMLYSTLLYTVYLCWPMFDLCSCSFSMCFIDLSFCCTKTSGKLGIPDPKSQKGAEVGAVLIGCNLCLAKTKYEISKIWYSMVYTV